MLVYVLALALTAANIAAAAMPPMSMTAAGGDAAIAALHHASAKHCADHAVAATHASQGGHAADCACCIGKVCACAQACDVPVPAAVLAPSVPSVRIFAVSPPRAYAAVEARPLRPPIA